MSEKKPFVVHFCKRSKEFMPQKKKGDPRIELCLNAWIDVDTNNASKPPTWKYCAECEGKGYHNPKRKPVDPEKSRQFKERMEAKRLAEQNAARVQQRLFA